MAEFFSAPADILHPKMFRLDVALAESFGCERSRTDTTQESLLSVDDGLHNLKKQQDRSFDD